MGTQQVRTYDERGPFLVGSLDSLCLSKRFCPAMAALVGLQYKINFELDIAPLHKESSFFAFIVTKIA